MTTNDSRQEKPATISLADEEAVKDVLTSTVFGLWDIVNNLTRLRPSKRERYRVTIFGSARVEPGHWVYAAVRDLARTRGYDLVDSYAYSDSVSDVPLLEAVGHPTAVNPDRGLRRIAA